MGWADQGTWSYVFAASNSPLWCYQELKFWPVWKHEKDLTASWCIILGFGGFAWTSAPGMGKGEGGGCLLSSFHAFKATNSLWFWLHQRSRDCKRTNNWVHEERTFEVLSAACGSDTQNFAITVILIDQWFFTGVRKLVKNLCFRICCGVMRFPGSRWSIFINKSTKRAKSSVSSSFIGKTWKNSSKTV